MTKPISAEQLGHQGGIAMQRPFFGKRPVPARAPVNVDAQVLPEGIQQVTPDVVVIHYSHNQSMEFLMKIFQSFHISFVGRYVF